MKCSDGTKFEKVKDKVGVIEITHPNFPPGPYRVRRFGNGDWEILDDGGSLRPCKITNPKHIEFFENMLQKGDVDYSVLKELEKNIP